MSEVREIMGCNNVPSGNTAALGKQAVGSVVATELRSVIQIDIDRNGSHYTPAQCRYLARCLNRLASKVEKRVAADAAKTGDTATAQKPSEGEI